MVVSQRRMSTLSNTDDELGGILAIVQIENPVESDDLYTTFKAKLDPIIYTVKAQLNEEGKATSFEVFRAGAEGEQPQKVFSSEDKNKTCSFSQPFEADIIGAYTAAVLEKTPEKILQISSCEDFATLKNFLDAFKTSEAYDKIKFRMLPELEEKIIQKLADSRKTGDQYIDEQEPKAKAREQQARQEVTACFAPFRAEQKDIDALLAKKLH